MKNQISDTSPRLRARIAGVFYLITIVVGIAGVSMGSSLIVTGDAAATAHRILGSELLYRLSFVSYLVTSAAYAVVTLLL